ncbi:uncharacterized protein LOC106050189 isoform X1 [Biomphalaria glabrata]|uniref:Pseudouridylate synthase RPUSD4, mitochondrial n=1 Tax=Biomphalaria glabrata TaxID=6526 RepID=A0A9W2YIZ4_BIOGL|nr:uncharacterized protein LOC106050189 isoform X1 [Biomphalaria glabrata]
MSLKLKTTLGLYKSESLTYCVQLCHKLLTQQRYFSDAPNHKNEPQNNDTDDFYGIPESFRLQQVRLRPNKTSIKKSDDNDSQDTDTTKDEIYQTQSRSNNLDDSHEKKHLSRKERRLLKHTGVAYRTFYGFVSFDAAAGHQPEEHVAKVENIFNNCFRISRNSKDSNLDVALDRSSARSSVDQGPNLDKSQFPSMSPPETAKSLSQHPSHIESSSLNYIDRNFFPRIDQDVHSNEIGTFSDKFQDQETRKNLENYKPSAANVKPIQEPSVVGLHEVEDIRYTKLEKGIKETNYPMSSKNIDFKDAKTGSYESNLNEVDEQYFGQHLKRNEKVNVNYSSTNKPKFTGNISEIDEQYFGSHLETKNVSIAQDRSEDVKEKQNDSYNQPTYNGTEKDLFRSNLNEVDEQYFGESFQTKADFNVETGTNNDHDFGKVIANYPIHYASSQSENSLSGLKQDVQTLKEKKTSLETSEGQSNHSDNKVKANVDNTNILSSDDFIRKKHHKKKEVSTPEKKAPTAYDMAMKIRSSLKDSEYEYGTLKNVEQQKYHSRSQVLEDSSDETAADKLDTKKVDSKGFKILKHQTLDLNKMTKADLTAMLRSRIIFDNEDFLAIDKPYGLPCISQKQDRVSITELLPMLIQSLSKSYKTSELHLVQNLERNVTGAIILAKNPEVASILKGMYNDPEVVTQRFWAITKGIPSPPKGLIDIPIGEGKIGNIYKMLLRPRYTIEEKKVMKNSQAPSERAITEYEILDSHIQAALVQCVLHTNNVKHQIRVHLASGLNTPILGDHKYSHFATQRPQKLHKEMLDMLKIRQAKVRDLVLHLHCRSVILKDYKGKMIFLTTRPPPHFKQNLESLKLAVPKKLL